MADGTPTANYGWIKPSVGASDDLWGGELNNDLDGIDSVVHGLQTSKYDAANPAGYQTAGQVAASLAPYALASAVPAASNTTPLVDGTASAGASAAWSRGDHAHPTDTTRYAASNPSGFQTAAQITASLGSYLPLAGGTLTGGLSVTGLVPSTAGGVVVAPTTGGGAVYLNGSSFSYGAGVAGQIGGSNRWWMALADGTSESGANTGSNFAIRNYSDAGALLSTPLAINRATGLVTIPNLNAPQAIGDNRIINGDMRIDQRNNGAAGTASGYTVDRWQYSGTQASKGSWQRVVNPPSAALGFPYAFAFSSSSAYAVLAADVFALLQSIEADMVSDFAWGTANAQSVTLSFWAISTLTGTVGGSIRNAAFTRSYPFTFSIPAGVWTKIVITIPGDTAGTWVMSGNAAALSVCFSLGTGATFSGPANAWAATNYISATGAISVVGTNGAAFTVTGVKLEIGSVATPFNRQSLAKSQADCERYFRWLPFNMNFPATAANAVLQTAMSFPAMRATPTISANAADPNTTQAGANQSSNSISPQSPYGGVLSLIAVAAGASYLTGYRASASAEL